MFIFWWFVCFFLRSRIDFQKKLDEKHKKQTSCPKVKHTRAANYLKGGPPIEAILVFFGRRALIFFVWKLLEKMKNDTTFVRMRSGDYLGRKNVEKGHLAPSSLTFLLIAIDRNGFRRMKEEGQIYKVASIFFKFCLGTY